MKSTENRKECSLDVRLGWWALTALSSMVRISVAWLVWSINERNRLIDRIRARCAQLVRAETSGECPQGVQTLSTLGVKDRDGARFDF